MKDSTLTQDIRDDIGLVSEFSLSCYISFYEDWSSGSYLFDSMNVGVAQPNGCRTDKPSYGDVWTNLKSI